MHPVPMMTEAEVEALIASSSAVDATALEGRAAALAARPITRASERAALDLVIRCMDLTTLEATDTADEIVAVCEKAARPDTSDPAVASVAAVCVFPQWVPVAVHELRGTAVAVASVAGAFPSGRGPLELRLMEIRDVVAAGAGEVDIVLNRSLFLHARYAEAFEELAAAREVAGAACLKVILETGELGAYGRVRQAALLAMAAGADFIKTSTGKVGVGAKLPAALCMMEAARDFHAQTGRPVGIKVAGGIRSAEQAIQYVNVLRETLGPSWLTPARFRIGASSLLNDVLAQLPEPG